MAPKKPMTRAPAVKKPKAKTADPRVARVLAHAEANRKARQEIALPDDLTDLSGIDLTGANLGSADLGSADLTRAKLTGADLSDADLTGALLVGADFTGALLDGVKGLPRQNSRSRRSR